MFRNKADNIARFAMSLAVVTAFAVTVGFSANSMAQASAPSDPADPSFSLTISALADKVKVSEPVKVNVVMKNISAKDIRVWYDSLGTEKVYKVIVKNEKGSAPEETKFKRDLKGLENPAYITPNTPLNFSGATATLKPNEEVTDPLNVSRLQNFVPGKYTIQVQRFDLKSGTFIKSNTIIVTVTP
jgi:hypothetical protein